MRRALYGARNGDYKKIMSNLAPAREARLQKSLARLYRFDGEIMTLQEILRDAASFEAKEVPKYDYNRIKFNRMDYREQAAYEEKLKQKKISYRAKFSDESFIEIPKMVYDFYTEKRGGKKLMSLSFTN